MAENEAETTTAPDAAAQLEKLQTQVRRYKRNLRKAEAEGFLDGILAMLQPGDLVLDCGANVGKISTLMARTGANVLAYEPDPYAFSRLTEACADLPNVTLHNAAVGASAGKIRLMRAQNFVAVSAGLPSAAASCCTIGQIEL